MFTTLRTIAAQLHSLRADSSAPTAAPAAPEDRLVPSAQGKPVKVAPAAEPTAPSKGGPEAAAKHVHRPLTNADMHVLLINYILN